MKRLTYTILIATLGLLMVFYAAGPATALVDFNAYKGAAISDAEIDGMIGSEWDDAGHYTDVAIDPSGTAEIWAKHDESNLYITIRFTADSNNPWIALQLGTTGCMDADTDVAIFGHDNLAADGYSDAYFSGMSVVADASQDGVGAMTAGAGNVVTIELKKPLNSGDTAGKDIAWSEGTTPNLVIAWDSDGGGSSGGSANHRTGTTPTARSILIDPNPISGPPENQPPNADFIYTSVELTVEFTDQSSDLDGTIVSWHWDFGDGSTSTKQNPTHTFPTMGKYEVTLNVTDDEGATDIARKEFLVPTSPEKRFQLWATQVIIVSATIVSLSLVAVTIATRKMGGKEGK